MTSEKEIQIFPGAIVCKESKLRGDITIGSGTMIHPNVVIRAEAGPIIIGDNCLIEEQSQIIHRLPIGQEATEPKPVLKIGSNNVFEVGCTVEAKQIGDNNVFESKSWVGNSVIIGNGCTVGAGCVIKDSRKIRDNIVIYGEECLEREVPEKPSLPTLQMEALSKILPHFHKIRRPNRTA